MNINDAKYELPNVDVLIAKACINCTKFNGFCPTLCFHLRKAKEMDFSKLQKAYCKFDGSIEQLLLYIEKAD